MSTTANSSSFSGATIPDMSGSGIFRWLMERFEQTLRRNRNRTALAALDEDQLKDVGIDPAIVGKKIDLPSNIPVMSGLMALR